MEPLSPPAPSSVIYPNPQPSTSSLSSPTSNNPVASTSRNLPPVSRSRTLSSRTETEDDEINEEDEEEVDGNPLRLLRMNKVSNVLPLPPKKKVNQFSNTISSTRSSGSTYSNSSRHQRKHPLLIPGRVSIPPEISTRGAPPPPPKPQRQITISSKQLAQPETPVDKKSEETEGGSNTEEDVVPKSDQVSINSSNFEHRSSASFSDSESSIPLYENYETEVVANEHPEISNNKVQNASEMVQQADDIHTTEGTTPTIKETTPEIFSEERRSLDFLEKRRNFESRSSANIEERKSALRLRSPVPMPQVETLLREPMKLQLTPSTDAISLPVAKEEPVFVNQHTRTKSRDVPFVPQPVPVAVGERRSPVKETATFGFIPPKEAESPTLAKGSTGIPVSKRVSPSKDAPVNLSPMKIKTVQRILGSSVSFNPNIS